MTPTLPARATTRLRQRLKAGPVLAASCYDALSARLGELAGFDALHLTGFGVEVSQVGAPDLGLMTLTELSAHAARITAVVDAPIIADVDTGFGGVLNVARTVREMERAGVAGIHIEDQSLPKRCPVLAGRSVVSRDEAVHRVRAACDARRDPDFVVVARTDADTISIAEVVARCNLYLGAGADMVMPMFMQVDGRPYAGLEPGEQMELLRMLCREIDGPVMGTGDTPPEGFTADDLAGAGLAFTMFVLAPLAAAANALAAAFSEIRRTGTVALAPGPYSDPMALMRAVHLDGYVAVERRYISATALPDMPGRATA